MSDRRDTTLHRMLDANLNRAFEALRTLEDIARFDNQEMAQRGYKSIRHQLQRVAAELPQAAMLLARDSESDVGKETKTDSEKDRSGGLISIAQAASQRAQQSLRVLEESSKAIAPEQSSAIESIRYLIYELNSNLLLSLERDRSFLANARVYLLVDCQLELAAFGERIQAVSEAGVALIQIRDKVRDAQEIIEYTRTAMASMTNRTRVIVNDRADVANVTRCFGLHVGQTDLEIAQARKLLWPEMVVGLSTHDVDQVEQAISLGADYIGCGPTFPSATKSFEQFAGPKLLQSVHERVDAAGLPAFAIGGIQLDNLSQVISAGFRRVAVSSAIWNASNPATAAHQMVTRLSDL
jgi:thiamine-phosphate pyrophosphorylase